MPMVNVLFQVGLTVILIESHVISVSLNCYSNWVCYSGMGGCLTVIPGMAVIPDVSVILSGLTYSKWSYCYSR